MVLGDYAIDLKTNLTQLNFSYKNNSFPDDHIYPKNDVAGN